jgi:hypothetical protein
VNEQTEATHASCDGGALHLPAAVQKRAVQCSAVLDASHVMHAVLAEYLKLFGAVLVAPEVGILVCMKAGVLSSGSSVSRAGLQAGAWQADKVVAGRGAAEQQGGGRQVEATQGGGGQEGRQQRCRQTQWLCTHCWLAGGSTTQEGGIASGASTHTHTHTEEPMPPTCLWIGPLLE